MPMVNFLFRSPRGGWQELVGGEFGQLGPPLGPGVVVGVGQHGGGDGGGAGRAHPLALRDDVRGAHLHADVGLLRLHTLLGIELKMKVHEVYTITENAFS